VPYIRQNIKVTVIDGNKINLEVGPFGQEIDISELFERKTFRQSQMLRNMRIARAQAGRPGIQSQEFRNAVNTNIRGMELANQRYFLHSIDTNSDGTLTANFSDTSNGQPSYGFTFDPIELNEANESPTAIVRDNLASWLRVDGATSLTPSVLQRLNQVQFFIWVP
jgi:hypothetical protein